MTTVGELKAEALSAGVLDKDGFAEWLIWDKEWFGRATQLTPRRIKGARREAMLIWSVSEGYEVPRARALDSDPHGEPAQSQSMDGRCTSAVKSTRWVAKPFDGPFDAHWALYDTQEGHWLHSHRGKPLAFKGQAERAAMECNRLGAPPEQDLQALAAWDRWTRWGMTLGAVALIGWGLSSAGWVAGSSPSDESSARYERGEAEDDTLRDGVEACLRGELPTWVDAATARDFCDSVYDVEEDLG